MEKKLSGNNKKDSIQAIRKNSHDVGHSPIKISVWYY
jgi:hypothetical protein